MFKIILLATTLVAFSNAQSSQYPSSSPSSASGYIYGPPQGNSFNYAAKSYGQRGDVASSWSNNLQYPRINALSDVNTFNAGVPTVSSLAAPYAHHGYNRWFQGYNTPEYYNTGYNTRPYFDYNYGMNYRGSGGWNYNRPYYPSIQQQN